MDSTKSNQDQVTVAASDSEVIRNKKKRLKLFGLITAVLVVGVIGVAALLLSKAAEPCSPGRYSYSCTNSGILPTFFTGQTLYANQALVSTIVPGVDGYQLILQGDGNLVVYNANSHAIWNTHTAGTGGGNRLVLQQDGNLVLYNGANVALWNSGTVGSGANRLTMQEDGNLVLSAPFGPVWSSYTGYIGAFGQAPTQISTNQQMTTGHTLVSADHRYMMALQPDGNLVVYNAARQPIWSSGTAGSGREARLILQPDGNLVLYRSKYGAAWNTETAMTIKNPYRPVKLVLQNDGNLVLYSITNRPVWSSYTGKLPVPYFPF